MLDSLNKEQQQWVDQVLGEMTLEECIASLLMPLECHKKPEEWRTLLETQPVSTMFSGFSNIYQVRASMRYLQEHSRHPVLWAVDFERGLGHEIPERTEFPWGMAYGAGGTKKLAEQTGRAIAAELREQGYHWTFGPVADLPLNPRESEVLTRAISSDPDRVIDMLQPRIKGLQAGGTVAACGKHFPGLGCDERDQHVVTTINPLSVKEWMATYGRIYKALFDAGLLTVMIAHASLPAWEKLEKKPYQALPASINKKLMSDLLRKELGFEGVIVSDAAPMCGLTTRVPKNRAAVEFIKGGGDVFLFSDIEQDAAAIRQALKKKELTEKRLWDSARRVVELKARLNLHRGVYGQTLTREQAQQHQAVAQEVADRSITVGRSDNSLPVKLRKGAKVLTVTIRYQKREDLSGELNAIDEELRSRGFDVTHRENIGGNDIYRDLAGEFDWIFINFVLTPHSLLGSAQPTGPYVAISWEHSWQDLDKSKVTFTSFGSAGLLHDYANMPNMLLAWCPTAASQRAAVKAWLGEIQPKGKLPVNILDERQVIQHLRNNLTTHLK